MSPSSTANSASGLWYDWKFSEKMFSYLWIFKCFWVLKATLNWEGCFGGILGSNSPASIPLLSHTQYHKRSGFLRTFWNTFVFKPDPLLQGQLSWELFLQWADRRQPAFLLCPQTGSVTSAPLGVHSVQGQWPQQDNLSLLTSGCLQTPLAAETKPHCTVWMSSAAP